MLGGGLMQGLRDAGYSVDWAHDGADGELANAAGGYGLILLDLGLPRKSGPTLLEDLRRRGDATPLMIITARDQTSDRVGGLDLGADDYLVKPFELSELLARIRAVVRRQRGSAVSTMGNGQVTINLASHEATAGGVTSLLSAKEFALLQVLLQRPGAIFSRSQLEERIYGWGEEVESNAVDVLIHAVRKKLGKDAIRNVRGAGWMVAPSDEI